MIVLSRHEAVAERVVSVLARQKRPLRAVVDNATYIHYLVGDQKAELIEELAHIVDEQANRIANTCRMVDAFAVVTPTVMAFVFYLNDEYGDWEDAYKRLVEADEARSQVKGMASKLVPGRADVRS